MPTRRSSVCSGPINSLEIFYDDSKSYWKARATLDIVIALHVRQQVFEVVIYNPELDSEAPRIYLGFKNILKHIDQGEVDRNVTEKKEIFLRLKKPFNPLTITKEVLDNLMLSYIMSRLNVISNGVGEGVTFVMALTPHTGDVVVDEVSHRLDVVIEKPMDLIPIETSFQKKLK